MSVFDDPLLDRRTAVLALSGAAFGLIAATPAKSAWSQSVSTSPIGAFVVGNPAAKVRLVEYFSYTCHICADFAKAGTLPLRPVTASSRCSGTERTAVQISSTGSCASCTASTIS